MVGHRLFALALCGAAALLSGCGSRPPASSGGPAANGAGYYKVGAPYQIGGVWYTPHEDWTYDQNGVASWYGEQFHGRYTANGEVFDLNELTAAHPTLPMPSIVEVTNLENGRSLRLRVNDRGPYINNRIIDVSRRAAQLLGFEMQGTTRVRVQILAPETQEAQALARRNIIGGVEVAAISPTGAAPVAEQTLPPAPVADAAPALALTPPAPPSPAPPQVVGRAPSWSTAPPVVARVVEPPLPAAPARVALVEPPAPPPAPVMMARVTPPPAPAPVLQPPSRAPAPMPDARSVQRIQSPEVPPPEPELVSARYSSAASPAAIAPTGPIYIQAGAFAQARNALQLKAKLDRLGAVSVIDATGDGGGLYRVRIGPMASKPEADRLLGRLVDNGVANARIVSD